MDLRGSLIDCIYKKFNETIDLRVIITVIGNFKGVVEENVSY
jgi:hypothetical protein